MVLLPKSAVTFDGNNIINERVANDPDLRRRIEEKHKQQMQENIKMYEEEQAERKRRGLDRCGFMGSDQIDKERFEFEQRQNKRKQTKLFEDTYTKHMIGL